MPKKQKQTPTTLPTATPQLPNWPPLSPLPDPEDLAISSLVRDQIFTIHHLFTSTLAQKYLSFLKTLPLVTTPGTPKRGDAVRVNDRFQIHDPNFARRLWQDTALSHLIQEGHFDGEPLDSGNRNALWGGQVLGLNPNIRVYRYSPGQFFDQHYDDSNNISFPDPSNPNKAIPARTTWTLLLYLSTCSGGETVFYPDSPTGKRSRNDPPPAPIAAAPEVGLALLHRHGNECMLHEGKEVTAGEKWVLRTDLCVKR